MKRIALVLSGGGTRGFAHIGVLKALEAYEIRPTLIVGISAGALVGVSYAAGMTAAQIEKRFLSVKIRSLVKPIFRGSGLLKSKPIVKELLSFIKKERFEELEIPFKTAGTDINTGKVKIFNSGPLAFALGVSISFPGVFAPKYFGNQLLSDGGITSIIPLHLMDDVDLAIIVNVASIPRTIDDHSSSLQVLENAIILIQNKTLQMELETLRKTTKVIYIQPPIKDIGFFDYHKARLEKLVPQGELASRKAFKQAKEDGLLDY